MSSFFGKHAAFIVPSYLITLIVFLVLFFLIKKQYRSRQSELAELERQGARRRSQKPEQPTNV